MFLGLLLLSKMTKLVGDFILSLLYFEFVKLDLVAFNELMFFVTLRLFLTELLFGVLIIF